MVVHRVGAQTVEQVVIYSWSMLNLNFLKFHISF